MAFDYSTIFSGGEQGDVWLADGAHFQDTARTTAAVADDPVGSLSGDQGHFNANQGTGSLQPTLLQTAGGVWYLEHSSDYLVAGTTSSWIYLHDSAGGSGAAYVCAAVRFGIVANPNKFYGLMGTSRAIWPSRGFACGWNDLSSEGRNEALRATVADGANSTIYDKHSANGALPAQQDAIFEIIRNGSTVTGYLNGNEVFTGTQPNSNSGSSEYPLSIGAAANGGYTGAENAFFTGRLYGLLVTDTVPDAATRLQIQRDMDLRLESPSYGFGVDVPAGTLGVAPLAPLIDKFINVPTGRLGITRLRPLILPRFVPPGNLGIQGQVPRGTGIVRFPLPSGQVGIAPETPSWTEIFRTAIVPLGNLRVTGIAPLGIQFLSSTVSDTADATDSTLVSLILAALGQTTADATDSTASLGEFPSTIRDRTAANADTALATGEFPLAYADTLDAVDAIAFTFLLQYADEGDVSDELVLTFLLAFRELVNATDELAYTGEYPLAVSSTGSVTDALSFVFPLYLESTADGSDTLDLTRLLALVSTAQAQDSSLSTLELVLALTTLAHAQDTLDWARLSELSDTGDATADAAVLVTASVQIADVLDATDSTSWTLALFVQLSDTAAATDTTTLSIEALASLLSSGHATDFVLTLDDTQERYTGRVMNTETGALSWYTNVPFESLAWDTHTKNLFALKSDGLYVFDADDDAGTDIDATVTTGVLDFQTDLMKRIDSAFIGYAGGSLLLQVHTTMGGTKQTNTYQMVPLTADVPRENVIKIGKGLKFSYCQFTLQNVDGADFELDRMTVYPVTLSRRRYS